MTLEKKKKKKQFSLLLHHRRCELSNRLQYNTQLEYDDLTYQIFVDLNPFFSNQNTDFPGKNLVDGKTFLTDLITALITIQLNRFIKK